MKTITELKMVTGGSDTCSNYDFYLKSIGFMIIASPGYIANMGKAEVGA